MDKEANAQEDQDDQSKQKKSRGSLFVMANLMRYGRI